MDLLDLVFLKLISFHQHSAEHVERLVTFLVSALQICVEFASPFVFTASIKKFSAVNNLLYSLKYIKSKSFFATNVSDEASILKFLMCIAEKIIINKDNKNKKNNLNFNKLLLH